MTAPTPALTELGHPQRVATAKRGMVATAHARASEAGARMFVAGGNAVDAAVASALALGVCEPAASGLGGQTMMLIHMPGQRTIAIDGSSRAPHRTPPSELKKAERLRGHRATTVPSTPATLAYVLERFGKLSWREVMQPSIDLAEDGYAVTELQRRLTVRELNHLREGTAAPFFLKDGKQAYEVGEILKQPVLARTLRRLGEHGVQDFYSGEIAKAIAADMEKHDGLIQLDDLAQVPTPIERRPIGGRFGSMRVFTFPPPGAGRALLFMLKLLDQFPVKRRQPDTREGALVLAEVIRRAMLDRRDRPVDPSFYPQIQDKRLLDDDYAQTVAKQIRTRIRTTGETTHLSTLDADGCGVALTQSIERVYGSFAASPDLGFLFNNYMSCFEQEDISHPYYLRPNAVPWASVAPTIVMQGNRPRVVLGSPGSERIVSAIAQVLLRLESQPLMDAITAPRMHTSLDGKVTLEASRMRSDLPAALTRRGFTVNEVEPFSFYLGCVQACMRERDGLVGVADLRRDGAAVGV
ncbi:MAG: gamma-glutamyltranspeptidase/glutathione hydrolase [Planctomycetota bacterium]|jgi:gamma-glutamyltranspeptidase/glutathione hydrolase